MGQDDLAARLRRLEDRQELRDLTVRYCRAMDDSDWDAVADTFAADTRFGELTGRAQVVKLLSSIRNGYGRTIHVAHGQLVEFIDDDHATGMVPAHAELDIDGQSVVCSMRYLDRYVREDGAWRFAEREIKFIYAMPWERMHLSMSDPLPVRWPGAEPAPVGEF